MNLRLGREPRGTESWTALLAVLRDGEDHATRVGAALEVVRTAAGTPEAHLYLGDRGGRLLLERSADSRAKRGDRSTAPADAPLAIDDGTADGAPLELVLDGEAGDGVVALPTGRFHALLLGPAGAPTVAVIVGPLTGADLPRGPRRAIEGLAVPLEVVAVTSRREHEVRSRLSAAEAREDAGRRLASSAVEPARYVELLLELSLRATGAEGGFVAMAEHDRTLHVRARAGLGPELDALDLSPERGVFDWSPAQEGGALIVDDIEAVMDIGIRSILAVPLLDEGGPLGIFSVVDLGSGRPLDPGALETLSTFARQIELMLRNERVYHDFSSAYLASLRGLAAALDERRADTRGHHAAVRRVARAMATHMGLRAAEAEALDVAAAIHDVGLAGIHGSEQAFEVDQEHPIIGAGMIEHLPLDPLVGHAVACHHEWHDGWGFPRGFAGDEIPVAGRILAAAEFIAEMQAGTPLREPYDAERLRAEVQRRRGTQFDPVVSEAAITVINQVRR
jgi:GAF domain-containing protein